MSEKLVQALAKNSGVAAHDVQKVLHHLGLNAALREVEQAAGKERVQRLNVGEMKVAFRLGKSSIAV